MDRMKTFLMYTIWVVAFIFISEFIITIGFEADYRNIKGKNEVSQVTITQAQATKISGRLKGQIKNAKDQLLKGNYIKFDFYSPRNVLLGTTYIDIKDMKVDETKEIDLHFKQKDVSYYVISQVDEKIESNTKFELLSADLSDRELLFGTFLVFLLIW